MSLIIDIAEETEYENDGLLTNGEIAIFVVEKDAASGIAPELSGILTECYIGTEDLHRLAEMNEASVGDQLLELFPDNNTMKSGDFGEILSRQFLHETEGAEFPIFRWRNRSTRNDTVRGTDLIGYLNVDDNATADDCLFLCEVKTRARSVKNEIVLDAYKGVQNDYASRMANSLVFCQARLLKDDNEDAAKRLARFRNPHKKPYKKKLIAAVVHKESTWDDDFLEFLPDSHNMDASLKVIILKIEDLAEFIDEVYEVAVEEAE